MKIDKNIPMPRRNNVVEKSKTTLIVEKMFNLLEVGDSTLLEDVNPQHISTYFKRYAESKKSDAVISFRKDSEKNYRFWRIR